MNSYFQLDVRPDGVYMILYPEQKHGTKLDVREVASYLERQSITYDLKLVMNEVLSLKDRKVIKISTQTVKPIKECAMIRVTPDKTKAYGRFYPPSMNGERLSREEIVKYLIQAGVKYGINESKIDQFILHPVYCTELELATYLPVVEGKSAKITYHFNTDLSRKPKTNEDGSVDFHQLENFSKVEKGALLATLQPAVIGKAGMDVCGAVITPHKVEKKILRHGRNIHLSEDGLSMYSDVAGHATVIDQKVFVENTYEVPANVDATTGDINYVGNVHIKGSVRTGYTVKAKGDIIVDDVVEGATLYAGGQIILKRGIQGMNKGSLHAEGNIITKFIENADITAGGYISTEAILHSNVTASGDIIVDGKRGFITGGEIRSGTMIMAKTVGSVMGTNTLLEVGIDPAMLEEYRRNDKQISEIEKEQEKINQTLVLFARKIKAGEKLPTDKIVSIRTITGVKESNTKKLKELEHTQEKLRAIIDNNDRGCVKIGSTIYPGCKVVISNVVYFVRTEMARCTLVREEADIRVGPYYDSDTI